MSKILVGRYELLETVGAGGMAVVYKAMDSLLGRVVAVKILREQFASDEGFVRRFRREAQSAASISHPNIVSVYDVGKEDADFIVMEYIEGRTLKNYIRDKAPFPAGVAIDVTRQVAEALAHAHAGGIIHQDIKPQNILITKDGRVKVTDFGIARAVSSDTVTGAGDIVGSVHYLSPEQAQGRTTGAQSDLYSLGVILFEMLTGRLPFDGDSPYAIVMKHLNDPPPSLTELNPAAGPELEKIVNKLLAKDMTRRCADAGELLSDLASVEAGRTVAWDAADGPDGLGGTKVHDNLGQPARGGGRQEKRRRKLIRRATTAAIALVLLIIVVAGVSALLKVLYVPEVAVPDLTDLTAEEAEAKLKDAGLTVDPNISYAFSDTVAKDRVIAQSVPAEEKVKQGRAIEITLSRGMALLKMPDLKSDHPSLENAKNRLTQAGFSAESIETVAESSSTVAKDHVINQDPAPGAESPADGKITLWISSGETYVMTVMPDVLSFSSAEAKKILSANYFVITVKTERSTLYPPDAVISTDPAPARPIMQGGAVTLVVSLGPGPPV
ncbi:MAG: Stk1 family PASTA domain-containing Ser/Thr kinase [Gracilibacteraceae bacterium]|nr:Stk1 family PASTA domain-containing Ser/Thr kinase [Gracilibacteraceae bacterium]